MATDVQPCAGDFARFCQLFLRHTFLPTVLAPVVAILFDAAEVFFVRYLLAGQVPVVEEWLAR